MCVIPIKGKKCIKDKNRYSYVKCYAKGNMKNKMYYSVQPGVKIFRNRIEKIKTKENVCHYNRKLGVIVSTILVMDKTSNN